jgi:GntR family transcriptional regulator, transcriptional repressor for pyruvate dehydrogenase complex
MVEKSEYADSGWRPVRKFRTHEHVLAAIEEQILHARLSVGDRLPGERDLAEMLGVSRPSVREALRVLEWMGVIAAGVGSGKDAGSIITAQSSEALTRLLRIHLALANFSVDNLVEVRLMLEAAATEAAAAHATPQDLEPLQSVLNEMSKAERGPKEFNELDTEFHVGIAAVSGNRLLSVLMQALRDVMEQEMVRAFEVLGPDWRKIAAKLNGEHTRVLNAIRAHDGKAASTAVCRHIRSFYRSMKSSGGQPRGQSAGAARKGSKIGQSLKSPVASSKADAPNGRA